MSTLKKRIPILDPNLSHPEFNRFIKDGKIHTCDTKINFGDLVATLTGYSREPNSVFYVIDFSNLTNRKESWGYISFSDIGILYFLAIDIGFRPVSRSEFFDKARDLSSQGVIEWLLWNLA